MRGVPECHFELKRNRQTSREKFAQLIGELDRFLLGNEMTAAGNQSAGRVNRNAAKRFDYEIATAARSSAADPASTSSLNPVANVARLSATSCESAR